MTSSTHHQLAGATLTRLVVSEMNNNVYVLRCDSTGRSVLIDAADDASSLLSLTNAGGPAHDLEAVITTHRHWDHHRALKEFVTRRPVETYAGRHDAHALPVAPTHTVQHGDTITIGDLTLHVIELRGHTPGSIALHWRDHESVGHLFAGDSLFPGGPGKTTSPNDFTQLMDDLEERVFLLPDDTIVYPGHGDFTTIGAERPYLGEWRERGW